ncbi:MAG: hypothetical protein A2Y94_10035 [Caldithrix sp. RBG_13_44_9]|nr:MAG: hypothetical protein A2Y94_10035 [Caldithrix sp. RBG_13_44_9]
MYHVDLPYDERTIYTIQNIASLYETKKMPTLDTLFFQDLDCRDEGAVDNFFCMIILALIAESFNFSTT